MQIPPQELLSLKEDGKLKALLVDVRDEVDFNQIHLRYGRMTPTEELAGQSEPLLMEPANTVGVAMSSD